MCSDCTKCQNHRYHCCYDPKPFINKLDALIMDVNVMALKSRTKANLQPIESKTTLLKIQDSSTDSLSQKNEVKTSLPKLHGESSTKKDSFIFSFVPNKL